jgi:hypothetical protein
MADEETAGAAAPETKTRASVSTKPAITTEDITAAIREEIAAWFVERVHDSPISRSSTEVVNYTREAVQALEDRLIARLAR